MGCRNSIKQCYVKYTLWECYINGMWSKVGDKKKESLMLINAIKFTKDHNLYGEAMHEVVFLWENSMLNFLTNKNINRKAYVGHCAVMHKLNIPEYIVRKAWSYLTEKEQYLANLEAEKNIKLWEMMYMEKLKHMSRNGKQDAITQAYQMTLL